MKLQGCFNSAAEESKLFCQWLVTKLSDIVEAAISESCVNKEALWPKLYQLQVSASFEEKWNSYLMSISVPVEPIFYQHYTRIAFDNLVQQKMPNREQPTLSSSPLTFEEENAIHYVGGYVVKTLRDV